MPSMPLCSRTCSRRTSRAGPRSWVTGERLAEGQRGESPATDGPRGKSPPRRRATNCRSLLAQGQVSEEEMMIDHHPDRRPVPRAAPATRDSQCRSHTCCPGNCRWSTSPAARPRHPPAARPVRRCHRCGCVATNSGHRPVGRPGDSRHRPPPDVPAGAGTDSCCALFNRAVVTVPAGPPAPPADRGDRAGLADDGAGGDQRLAARQQCRHQIGEGLAGAGARLGNQATAVGDRILDPGRHLLLT